MAVAFYSVVIANKTASHCYHQSRLKDYAARILTEVFLLLYGVIVVACVVLPMVGLKAYRCVLSLVCMYPLLD
jgi:hypothetical protein